MTSEQCIPTYKPFYLPTYHHLPTTNYLPTYLRIIDTDHMRHSGFDEDITNGSAVASRYEHEL
jgi:hypothetical protein